MSRSKAGALGLAVSIVVSVPGLAQGTTGLGCPGASGVTPSLALGSTPFTGQKFTVDVGGPADMLGMLIVGISNSSYLGLPLPLELSCFNMPGCFLCTSFDLVIPLKTDSLGVFQLEALGPEEGSTCYMQVYLQDFDFGAFNFGGLSECLAITGAGIPPAGAVVVHEIMKNPSFVADAVGEWFELRNTTDLPIDLEGWSIADNKGVHVVDRGGAGLILPAQGNLVLGRSDDPALNGGIVVHHAYGDDLRLANNADSITLFEPGGALVDEVRYDDGATFPNLPGRSISLSPAMLDAAANDLGSSWCSATTPIGGAASNTDAGTPGADNPSCP